MAGIGRYALSEPSRAVKLRIVKSSFRIFCIVNYSITKNSYNCK